MSLWQISKTKSKHVFRGKTVFWCPFIILNQNQSKSIKTFQPKISILWVSEKRKKKLADKSRLDVVFIIYMKNHAKQFQTDFENKLVFCLENYSDLLCCWIK